MEVAICCSSSDKIDDYYLSIARSVAEYLAKNELNLVFGACSKSMMGIFYQEFKKHNRKIYSYTTEPYKDDLNNIESTFTRVCETTFDLKKGIYENSDMIVVLPGGIGTISEVFSFIEEARSNDKDVPVIIYDEDRLLEPIISSYIRLLIGKGFNDSSILSYFKLTHTPDEFKEEIEKIIYSKKEKQI